jgi:outer membrane protein
MLLNLKVFRMLFIFYIFCLLHLNYKINQNKYYYFITISISVVACNKTAEVKEVKTADTSVLMKEYTEAKDLEEKYKAQSSERKTTKLKLITARCIKFSSTSTKLMDKSGRKKRSAELQKRTRLGYAQQALAQQLQQQGGNGNGIVSELKNSLKITEKRTDILTYMELEMQQLYYMLRSMILQRGCKKALNDKYKLLQNRLKRDKSRRKK